MTITLDFNQNCSQVNSVLQEKTVTKIAFPQI